MRAMRAKLKPIYTTCDMGFFFQKWNFNKCVENNLHRPENRSILSGIIKEYLSLIARDMTTTGYVAYMGYGLGYMYLGSKNITSAGSYPKYLATYMNKLDFPNNPEFIERNRKSFYDRTNYRIFTIKWKRYKLKNIRSYSVLPSKTFKRRINDCVLNKTLKHY